MHEFLSSTLTQSKSSRKSQTWYADIWGCTMFANTYVYFCRGQE